VPTIVRARSVSALARSGRPSQVAPAPRAALHSRPEAGSAIAPASDSPSRVAANETAYQGSP
jgi:hypothetical protein